MAAVQSTPHGENILEVESRRDGRIRTLDQLLKACQVDLKVWEVERYTVNKWEVGAKDPDGEIVVTPLFQVKATLRRKVMKAGQPIVRPIDTPKRYQTYTKPPGRRKAVHTALILPDPQFGFRRTADGVLHPFHDWRALDVAIQMAYEVKPSYIICLGDMLDLPEWSDKFPERPNSNRRRNRQLWPRTGGCGACARPGRARQSGCWKAITTSASSWRWSTT